jgi:hypothetical protein
MRSRAVMILESSSIKLEHNQKHLINGVLKGKRLRFNPDYNERI